MIRPALLSLCLVLTPLPALAHKVIASVFPSGARIEGEIGFSDGAMARDTKVEVLDAQGNRIGEATTDGEGFFTYAPTAPVALVFRANLGAGHVAEARMSAEAVATIVAKRGAAAAPAAQATPEAPAARASLAAAAIPGANPGPLPLPQQSGEVTLSPAEHEAIATIVRDEMRPLRREIDAYKEKNDLQSILGGIGYIFGLAGVGYYLAARQRLRHAA
ncbi:cobalt ABC transporter permease [Tropicimonas sp. IMCC34043]|uniref:cobalt ABC transporter permease n=1 Tax=Tropicimonas sp. IMCC34043 TaxID=2248760 RepID=UPI000E24AF4A|nr:cobalt ABC transporter permease [Tropicimonas sp. IMCC34043]